jgi:hypothetical protein
LPVCSEILPLESKILIGSYPQTCRILERKQPYDIREVI